MGQHLGFNIKSNVLRRRLETLRIAPEACEFRLIAHGPILAEAESLEEHRCSRDVIAALEKALAEAMSAAGYDVINRVNCRMALNDDLFAKVRAAFAPHFHAARVSASALRLQQNRDIGRCRDSRDERAAMRRDQFEHLWDRLHDRVAHLSAGEISACKRKRPNSCSEQCLLLIRPIANPRVLCKDDPAALPDDAKPLCVRRALSEMIVVEFDPVTSSASRRPIARPMDASMKRTSARSRRFVAERFFDFREGTIVVLRQTGDRVTSFPALVKYGRRNRRPGDYGTAE